MQPRDPLQDLDLDRVHVDGAEDVDRHLRRGRRPPEPCERGEDLVAVVGLAVVAPDDDPVLVDPQPVGHAGQVGEHPARVADERREGSEATYARKAVAERHEARDAGEAASARPRRR